MGTDETQMEPGAAPGEPQKYFHREPREPHENVLRQSRRGAKMGNLNHGWTQINTDLLTRVPQILRHWTNLKPLIMQNTRTQIPLR